VILAGMLASVTAFMQNPEDPGREAKLAEEKALMEATPVRPQLGPGVALTYPELDMEPPTATAPEQPAGQEKVSVPHVWQTVKTNTAPAPLHPAAAITCNGAGGNWNSAGSWNGGIPTAANSVIITNGCTIVIDTAAVALDITVQSGGILQFDNATGTLTAGQSVTIDSGGTFQTDPAGTVTTHTLSVGTNLTNNGTLDFSTSGNTAGADITFTGAANNIFSGSGGTTDIRTLTINKGTSSANTLEVTTTNFSVQGTTTDGAPMAFLTLTNGTLKMSGGFTLTGRFFTAAAYVIPATAGIWINNANVTVAAQGSSPTNNGLLRVSSGTFNVGTISGNAMGAGAGAQFIVEGGTMNFSGRLNSANAVTYTQSGGTVNVCTVGNAAATPSFGFSSTLPTNVMNISGGTINLVQANTNAAPLDYNQQGTINFTGGTLNVGTAATATNFVFRAQGNMPSVVIDNTTNNKTLNLSSTGYVYGNFNMQTGTTFNPNASILDMFGSTFTNNGTITGCLATSATSRLQFAGAVAQSYTGTGTVCTAANPLFGFAIINRGPGVTIDPAANPINVARLLLFSGSLVNTNKINLIQNAANVMVIQRGGVAFLPAGNADVAPTIPVPTFLILVYSQANSAVTTGVEIPSSRTVDSVQEFNTNGVTLAGGPLTITGNAGAAPDTIGLFLGGTSAGVAGGPLNTSAANLITVVGTAAGTVLGGSGMAYINGPLARTLPASLVSGSTYVFPVGKSLYKQVELVNPTTNAGGPVTVQAEVFDSDSGGTAGAGLDAINNNRYWNVQITAGAANFTNSTVRVTELNSTGNALGQSATQGGAYASIGGTLTAPAVLSTAVTSLGFFAVGRLTGTTTFPGGTYTVGSGGAYATLTAAMADLSGKIITGPIVYSLLATYTSGGETFPIVVPANGGENATNTITIKPASGATITISGSSASAMIELLGADYVTIDGSNAAGGTSRDLTIKNTNVSTLTAAVWVASQGTNAGATFSTIKNTVCSAGEPAGGNTTGIFGIFAGGTPVGTNGNDNDFLKIQNNAVDTAYEGIAVRVATVLDGENDGLNINNNLIGSATAANFIVFRGIEIIGAGYPTIHHNEIFGVNTTLVTSHVSGIELGSTVFYAQVTRNFVHDIINNEPGGSGAFGIEISSATNEFNNSFINNAINGVYGRGFSTSSFTFDPAGIRLLGGAAHKVYFNTVNMSGAMVITSLNSAFVADSTTDQGLDLRDNVFVNSATGPVGSKAYGTFITTATAFGTSANLAFGTINYNDYYSTGTANVAGFLNFYGVDHTTLSAWRASTQNDVNSITADPLFINATNLDLQGGSPALGAGQTIAGITIDLLSRVRANPPAMGAYEPGGTTAAPGSISGRLTTTAGGPLEGVTINLSGSRVDQAVTDGNGFYRFDNLTINGFYSITPALEGFSFSPATRSFSLLGSMADASFTAIAGAPRAAISGVISTDDGQPLGGVTVRLSGGVGARTITDALGRYRFDNVATDGFYIVTPGLANYSFNPVSRSFALLANKTDAVFTAHAAAQSQNPLNGADFFVRQQYLDFLGREPDAQGWLYWTDQINRCGMDQQCMNQRRLDVSAAFFMSDEFQASGNYIYRLYRAGLGRQLSYAEFTGDHQKVIGGADLESLRTKFADEFVQRAAFVEHYQNATSAEGFVDALLRNVGTDAQVDLLRQREALIATYNSGGDLNQSRSAVLRAIAERSEFKSAVYNPSFVLMEYYGYLQRDIDQNGFNFWVNVLNNRDLGNYRGMVCSFMTSAEYQLRFSPVVTHSNAECSGQ